MGKPGFVISPDNITIIGGGRWARVITQVVDSIVAPTVNICVYSLHNASSFSNWIAEQGLTRRIKVFKDLPGKLPLPNAVIVANSARDHEKAAAYALSAGAPVLVEKPITLSHETSRGLVDLAHKLDLNFTAAHIFLFARYIDNFSKLVLQAGDISFINIRWTDPASEERYGEKKQYDASLPVFADWLPHILSIIWKLLPEMPQSCENMQYDKGGATLELLLRIGSIPCNVSIARNSERRIRLIEVVSGGKNFKLDFSTEPGMITSGNEVINGDPDWDNKARPLASMLNAFLKTRADEKTDPRLSSVIGLNANIVIDQAMTMYRSAQMSWLLNRLSTRREIDEDLTYALTELLQSGELLSTADIEKRTKIFMEFFLNDKAEYWIKILSDINDPTKIVRICSM